MIARFTSEEEDWYFFHPWINTAPGKFLKPPSNYFEFRQQEAGIEDHDSLGCLDNPVRYFLNLSKICSENTIDSCDCIGIGFFV